MQKQETAYSNLLLVSLLVLLTEVLNYQGKVETHQYLSLEQIFDSKDKHLDKYHNLQPTLLNLT